VLQVLPALVTGGVERGTVDIAASLVAAGWRAIVASSGGPMVRELERAGAEHVTLPLDSKNPLRIRRNIKPLVELIQHCPVDLVHARSRAPAWSALWAANRSNTAFVTTVHSTYGGASRAKRWYNSVMGKGARVIAISDFVGAYATETLGVGPDRLRVIPRGVDLDRFDPALVTAPRLIALARQWRLEDGKPVVMLPGRITRWKGQIELIDAIAWLGRSDIQVLLVGSEEQKPQFRDELIRRIGHHGLGGVVRLVGDCRDMPAAYMLADVVVSASIEPEGFGRVAVEAQAMGRPLVATDHGGSQETIAAGETGWLVPPGDPAALAEAIEGALALDPEQREVLGERGRAWVAQNFTIDRMCAATLAVYEELLYPAATR
jgi:glycosyltransferase involved in cell wall biosynthesis